MEIVHNFLLPVVLPIIVFGIVFPLMIKNAKKAEEGMDASDFVVRQPKFAFWIGIICMIFFGIGSVVPVIVPLFIDDIEPWWNAFTVIIFIIFILFSLSGAYLAVYCKLWKLEVTGNEMRLSTLTKRNVAYKFEDIKRVRLKNNGSWGEQVVVLVVYGETKKLFAVETNCPGYNVLIARLKQAGIKFE